MVQTHLLHCGQSIQNPCINTKDFPSLHNISFCLQDSLYVLNLFPTNLLFTSMDTHLIEDIKTLEKVQHRATKWILQDYSSDYKVRLTPNMLPLMMPYEIYDIILFLKSITSHHQHSINLTMSSSIHLPQEHNHKLRTQYSRINKSQHLLLSSSQIVECSTYLRPHINVSCQSCCIHHFFSSTIFKITAIHLTPAHFTINVPVAPSILNLTYSDDSLFNY